MDWGPGDCVDEQALIRKKTRKSRLDDLRK